MRCLVLLLLVGIGVLGLGRPGSFRDSDEDSESLSVEVHPNSQKVMEGSPIVLTCTSSLRTYIEFQWKIGFKLVTSDYEGGLGSGEEGVHVHQTADNISVLRIDSANMKEHRRKISCEVRTEDGRFVTAQSSIKIFKKGSKRRGFPAIQSHPESPVVFKVGDRLTLSCTSNIGPESREAPEWRWIKNGTWDLDLYEAMDERIEISDDSGTLEIFSITGSDAGSYECVAENRRGSSYSPPIEVIVEPEARVSQRSCVDHKFNQVPHGSIYQPYPDPCTECECVDGMEKFCAAITCDEPPCQHYEVITDTCCGFRCLNETVDWSVDYGSCWPYTGMGCKEFLMGRSVYLRPQHSQDSVENELKQLFRGAQSLSESCMEYILPFLCFNAVPLCDVSTDVPRGRHVCREDCEVVANICQDELIVFRDQYALYSGNDAFALPRCQELPTRYSSDGENCVGFKEFLDDDRSINDDKDALPDDWDWPDNRRRESNSDGDQCIDRLGNLVNDGDLFLPERDPCLACICDEGSKSMCTVVACEPPPCRNYEKMNDSCCGYICREGDVIERDEPCIANNGSYIQNGEYQPGSDPCMICMCVDGKKMPCRTVMCIPPKCPKYAPNSVRVPGTCCEFECRSVESEKEELDVFSEPCIANNGSYIQNGEYQPGSDPCMICMCVDGKKMPCRTVMCIPPKCPKYAPNSVRVPGTCCEFECRSLETEEEELGVFSEPCIANNGSYIMNGAYHPTDDLCMTCLCKDGVKQPCMSVGCMPPRCTNRLIKVPGTCCEFRCGDDDMDKLDLTSPQAPGSLSVQQVGANSAIVQWKMGKTWEIEKHSSLSLLYNCTMNSTLVNMTIPADLTYIFLDDLHLNAKYQFILLSTYPKDRVVLDIVNFALTGRAGRGLFLGDASNGEVYQSNGNNMFLPMKNGNNTHIMLSSFHRIELRKTDSPPCRNRILGCNVMQFSLYNDDGYGVAVLALMFEDERDFNWAKAHL